jgi:hypothetical protein
LQSTVAAIEVQDFINFFASDLRFDPFSGWGILINESNGIGTKSFTLDRFTLDCGGDDGVNPLAVGLLKSAGDGTRRGDYRIANGRIEVNGPMAEPKAMVLVEGLLESRGGRFVFDTVELETSSYGTDVALIRYLPTTGTAYATKYGPDALFINCRQGGNGTYWYRDLWAAGHITTAAVWGELFGTASATEAQLGAHLTLAGMEFGTAANDARLTLKRQDASAGTGQGLDIEQQMLQANIYTIADVSVPGTRTRAIAIRNSTGNVRIGGTANPTTDKLTVDGAVALEESSSSSDAIKMRSSSSTADWRLVLRADGRLAWGDGTAATDLFLARSAAGVAALTGSLTVSGSVTVGTSGPKWQSGTGTPEGAVTAPVGSLFSRTDGGASTTLYVKESGAGNTGWVAK